MRRSRSVAAFLVLVSISSLALAQEAPPPAAPVPPPTQALQQPPRPRIVLVERWYGWQNLLIEMVLPIVGSGIIHLTHGHGDRAAIAVAGRAVTFTMVVVGVIKAFAGGHDETDPEGHGGGVSAVYPAMFLAGMFGYGAVSVYDIGWLAREKIAVPLDARRRPRIFVAPAILPAEDGLRFGLAGGF